MVMFTLRLLGSASLDGPNGPVSGRASLRQRVALLALLAAEHPHPLSRDKLVAYLWPESGTDDARHLLRDSLYILRSTLGENSVLSAGDDLRLNPDRLACDLWEFEAALGRDDPARAVEVYRGPFLSGFHLPDADEFERWTEGERSHLAHRHAQALEQLAERHMRGGDAVGAIGWWTRLAREDPYNSRIALRLMQALEAGGDRAGALRHASVHTELLRTDLDVAPAPEVIVLAERIRRESLPLQGVAPAATEPPRAVSAALDGGEARSRIATSTALSNAAAARENAGSETRRWWIVPPAVLLVAAVAAMLVRSRAAAPSSLDSNLVAVAPFDVVAPALRP